jgi:hypothetical protein
MPVLTDFLALFAVFDLVRTERKWNQDPPGKRREGVLVWLFRFVPT